MKIEQNSFPNELAYSDREQVFIQQSNYHYCKEIVFNVWMYKETCLHNSNTVAVFRVQLKPVMQVNNVGQLVF